MFKDTKLNIIGILGIIVVILLCLLMSTCNSKKRLVEKLVLEQQQKTSKTETMASSNVNDFLNLKTKDSTIIYLQGKVKYYKSKINNGGSVTVITNTTDLNATGVTTIIHDTNYVNIPNQIEIFPVYEMTLKNKWYQGRIKADKDSTNLKLSIDNEYTVIIGDDSKWYQKSIPFTEVTNLNPYTKTKSIKTYVVINNVKTKHYGIGAFVGYGIGIRGLTPILGIGVQYNLIKW